MREESETHFGAQSVKLEVKQTLVNRVFAQVAERYDLMNDLMSLGLHRAWKDRLVTKLAPPRHKAYAHLDVAGGTGDIAFRIARVARLSQVTVADINPEMLAVGRARAQRLREGDRLSFLEANAEALPFADASFDGYTIAFGIRNVPRMEKALQDAWRVLRPGGRFLCLEFSTVDMPGLDRLYRLYSDLVIPPLGHIVTGDGAAYRYLVESIRRFPSPEAFADRISAAGFARVHYECLSGGIVAIHSGWKL